LTGAARGRRRRRIAKKDLPAQAAAVRARLARAIPAPRCELDHQDAWQLLVATILSAQSTDKMVNQVTPALFRRWPTAAALAGAPLGAIEEMVRRTGFYRQKAKNLQATAALLVARHGGEVPRTMEEMTALKGVARKTANVVLGTAYRIASGITVDTHATRVSGLLGLTRQTDPKKIESELMALVPQGEWIDFGHRLVLHGRYTCIANRPKCGECACADVCPSVQLVPAPRGARAARATRGGRAARTAARGGRAARARRGGRAARRARG
jgi:endonuclease-3